MYTVTYKSKTKNAATRKIIVTVSISDGVETFEKPFEFPLYTTRQQIERIIKEYVEELQSGDSLFDSIPPKDTVLNLATVGSDITPEKAAFMDFLRDTARRERVQKLIEWGIVPANNPRVVALNTKIQATLQANPTFVDRL